MCIKLSRGVNAVYQARNHFNWGFRTFSAAMTYAGLIHATHALPKQLSVACVRLYCFQLILQVEVPSILQATKAQPSAAHISIL